MNYRIVADLTGALYSLALLIGAWTVEIHKSIVLGEPVTWLSSILLLVLTLLCAYFINSWLKGILDYNKRANVLHIIPTAAPYGEGEPDARS